MTALHASSEEVVEWTNKEDPGKDTTAGRNSEGETRLMQSQEATSSGSGLSSNARKTKYHFICECFFMTARVLNLGLLKAFSDFKHLVQVMARMTISLFSKAICI